MRTIIDSGHWAGDPGAVVNGYNERDICKKIRDEVKKMMPAVVCVPDEFDLRKSIDWVNSFCSPDDLCISVHLNSNNDQWKRGCEAYYSDNSYLASIFVRNIANSLPTLNLGSKHDSMTFVGSLGWLRQLKAQSVLVEVCYLSNSQDWNRIITPEGQRAAAIGIVKAIEEHTKNLGILVQLKQVVATLLDLLKQKYGKI